MVIPLSRISFFVACGGSAHNLVKEKGTPSLTAISSSVNWHCLHLSPEPEYLQTQRFLAGKLSTLPQAEWMRRRFVLYERYFSQYLTSNPILYVHEQVSVGGWFALTCTMFVSVLQGKQKSLLGTGLFFSLFETCSMHPLFYTESQLKRTARFVPPRSLPSVSLCAGRGKICTHLVLYAFKTYMTDKQIILNQPSSVLSAFLLREVI